MFNARDYYLENRDKILTQASAYYYANREACIARSKKLWRRNRKKYQVARDRWMAAHRWTKHYYNMKARCQTSTTRKYKYYGGKGIKCLLTMEDVERLWHRDNAAAMRSPSLDRRESSGDYVFDNCQFIEFDDNRRKRSYGLPNAHCRSCSAAFVRTSPPLCASSRKIDAASRAKYPPAVRLVREKAFKHGLTVDPVFCDGAAISMKSLRIAGKIVVVNTYDGGREDYAHFRKSAYPADVRCLVYRTHRRREIVILPGEFLKRSIFIPLHRRTVSIGRAPSVDWLKFKNAWHVIAPQISDSVNP